MVSTETHEWPCGPITVEFFGGPRDGATATWRPGDEHWVRFGRHLYLLVGNLDDGFRFVYEGVTNVK